MSNCCAAPTMKPLAVSSTPADRSSSTAPRFPESAAQINLGFDFARSYLFDLQPCRLEIAKVRGVSSLIRSCQVLVMQTRFMKIKNQCRKRGGKRLEVHSGQEGYVPSCSCMTGSVSWNRRRLLYHARACTYKSQGPVLFVASAIACANLQRCIYHLFIAQSVRTEKVLW